MSYSSILNELQQQIDQQTPSDLLQFCADFFHQKLSQERSTRSPYSFGQLPTPSVPRPHHHHHHHEEEEDEEEEEDSEPESDAPDPREIPPSYNLGRRTSVSAESLSPSTLPLPPKTIIPKSPDQISRIELSISKNLLFRNLDEAQYTDVVNAMTEVSVAKGTEVIIQGAVGDFFYVIESGTFSVYVREPSKFEYVAPGQSRTLPGERKKVTSYGPGGSFGELALMYNAPRAATVVSTSEGTLWALDRVTFRSILMEHTSRKRKMYETFLSSVDILSSLTEKERSKIADALEEKIFDQGEKVIVQGEVGKNFYIVESGIAVVTMEKSGDQVLKEYTKGDYFGGTFLPPPLFRAEVRCRRTGAPQCDPSRCDRASETQCRQTSSRHSRRKGLYKTARSSD